MNLIGVDQFTLRYVHDDLPPGPTLMFERFYPDKPPRKFFACAVHRDRKGCPFFVWADEKIPEEKRERQEEKKMIKCDAPSHGIYALPFVS